ncbi:MAG: biotin/lipoyl-binding protein [Planctomycetota bacterium]
MTAQASVQSLLNSRFRVADTIRLQLRTEKCETFCIISDGDRDKYFHVGINEYYLLSLLADGNSIAEAVAIAARQHQEFDLAESKVRELVIWALRQRILIPDRPTSLASSDGDTQQVRRFSPFWFKIPICDPSQILSWISRQIRQVPTVVWLAFGSLIFLNAIWIVLEQGQRLAQQSAAVFGPSNWLWMLFCWIALKLFHELGHGLSCHLMGGTAKRCGVILVLFAPLAYIDVSSSWQFCSRMQRIVVAISGVLAEFAVASIALVVWSQSGSLWVQSTMLNLVWLATLSSVLFNINPLMRFDGYYILSDLIGKPNLHDAGISAVKSLFQRLCWGNNYSVTKESYPTATLLYGIACLIWRLFVCCSLVVAASALFDGVGVFVALFGLFTWFIRPLWEAIQKWFSRWQSEPHRAIRCLAVCSLAAILLGATLSLPPLPYQVAHCVVELHESATTRCPEDAQLVQLLIKDGEHVDLGQTILVLDSQELRLQIQDLELELAIAQQLERDAKTKHNPGDRKSALREQIRIRRQLQTRKKQLLSLTLKANQNGTIQTKDLEAYDGATLQRGMPLFQIINNDSLQLHLALPSSHGEIYRGEHSATDVQVNLNNRGWESIRMDPSSSIASREVRNLALATIAGGPIPVTVDEANPEKQNFLSPVIRMNASLSGLSAKPRAGELGIVKLPAKYTTIGELLFYCSRDWIREKLKQKAS